SCCDSQSCQPAGSKICSGNNPQQCASNGQWQNEPACTMETPTCSAGECICTETMCNSGCVDLQTDKLNCGACGRSCALANASTTSCNGGACAPTCQAGYLNCNVPVPPAPDDGCECAGPMCCGSSCPSAHNDGL